MNNPVLITAGDFAGINPYILLKSVKQFPEIEFHLCFDNRTLEIYSDLLNIEIPNNLKCLKSKAVINNPEKGNPSLAAAISLQEAVRLLKRESSLYKELITLPVNKSYINKHIDGFSGHTEYLGKEFHSNIAMILYSSIISVCPLTTHIPIDKVTDNINEDLIKGVLKNVNDFYLKFLNKKPKITFVCINPHCSDGDLLSNSDNVFKNTIEKLRNDFLINGPISSDTAFLPEYRDKTDIYLCPSHDQALIPFKMLAFNTGINITAGLPFLRVSPGHGPAYNMVSKTDQISIGSLVKCIEFIRKI
ncbi:4-hydroxythreonine-4-phosphate dehydrogenase PdxA [candidate division WOR-3 bacterium]|nr:4-hydroxythreonine-4-phosphate dehydrogenase PdxA [candidate division WOR-3 bacterium]